MTIIQSFRLALMSYQFLAGHFSSFLRLALPWSIASGTLVAIGEYEARISTWFLLPIASTCICVAWCRAILLDRPPTSSGVFGAREWRFLRVSLIPSAVLFGLATVLAGSPWAALDGENEAADLAMDLGTIAVGAFWMLLMAPLLLARAAITIDDSQFGVYRSVRESLRIILPIFLGAMIAYAPMFLIQFIDGGTRSSDLIGISTIMLEYSGYALLDLASSVALAGFAAYLYRMIACNSHSLIANQF